MCPWTFGDLFADQARLSKSAARTPWARTIVGWAEKLLDTDDHGFCEGDNQIQEAPKQDQAEFEI